MVQPIVTAKVVAYYVENLRLTWRSAITVVNIAMNYLGPPADNMKMCRNKHGPNLRWCRCGNLKCIEKTLLYYNVWVKECNRIIADEILRLRYYRKRYCRII